MRCKPNSFNPTEHNLVLSNKTVVSRFDFVSEDGIYTVNVNNFSSSLNLAARGYVTYVENGTVKTVYSNQINIVNTEQI